MFMTMTTKVNWRKILLEVEGIFPMNDFFLSEAWRRDLEGEEMMVLYRSFKVKSESDSRKMVETETEDSLNRDVWQT
jgi:hypothetical protein